MDFTAENNFYNFYASDSEEENHTHCNSAFERRERYRHPAEFSPIPSRDFPDYDEEQQTKYLNSYYYNKSNNSSTAIKRYDNYNPPEHGFYYSAPHHAGSGASSNAESDTESTGELDSEAYGYTNGLENDSEHGHLGFEEFRWHMQQRVPNVHDDSDVLSVLKSTIQYIQQLTEAAAVKSQNADSLSEDLCRINFNEYL